jgi:hypothetical protein
LAGGADALADKAAIGHAFIGIFLLGAMVSLPEMTFSAVAAARGNAELAVNGLLGGIGITMVVADFVVGREPLSLDVRRPAGSSTRAWRSMSSCMARMSSSNGSSVNATGRREGSATDERPEPFHQLRTRRLPWGTDVIGEMGLDLTHIASRRSLGSGILPNDRETMSVASENARVARRYGLAVRCPSVRKSIKDSANMMLASRWSEGLSRRNPSL